MNNVKIIYETIAGSHLYGTNVPESDMDYRGVCFEPLDTLLGLEHFEQFEQKSPDRTIFGLRKFTQLALDNNPNIVELLFAPMGGDTLVTSSLEWQVLRSYRDSFLSRKIAKTFVGYARSQAKRMQTHYEWMSGVTPEKPNPFDYGRIFDTTTKEEYWTDVNRKQAYENTLARYTQYQTWVKNRNPKRHELEEKWGYDTKHGMHLVRLLSQGMELIRFGTLTLPRPDAAYLLQIRQEGLYTYPQMMELMDGYVKDIDLLTPESPLPEKPATDVVNEVVKELNYEYIRKSYE